MKKIILLLFYCLIAVVSTKAQTVFAPPNSVWHYGFIDSDGEDGLNYSVYKTSKDTLYETQLCSKVEGREYTAPSTYTNLPTQYIYTSNDTVFYYNFNFSKFLPLYKFNVSKGDTLKFHVPYLVSGQPDTFRVVVDSTYNITIDGNVLREVDTRYLDRFALDTYTERLGNGAFIGHHFVNTTGFANYLSCYQDGIMDTNFTNKPCGYLKSSNISDVHMNSKIVVYPNPFVNQVTIEIAPSIKNLTVQLYDMLGQKIIEMNNANGDIFQLNTNQLPKGIYFISVKNFSQETISNKALLKL
jgi:hypothetical protein